MDRAEILDDAWRVFQNLADSLPCSLCRASAEALARAERELLAERERRATYERASVSMAEEAAASRSERAFDAEEAALCRALLAESEAREQKHKRAASFLREEIGKLHDAAQTMLAALEAPKARELSQLARRLARKEGENARVWDVMAKLASAITDSRTSAVERARSELESARRELAGAFAPQARDEKLKAVAEGALRDLAERKAECEWRKASEAKLQSLYAAVSGEYKRMLQTTRVTVQIASADTEAMSAAERGAIRASLDLLMAPESDESGLVAALLHATCPVAAVAAFERAGHSCRASATALRELSENCTGARARSAFLQAVHIYASEIGGEVAHKAVQSACLLPNDPIIAAQIRANTAQITQYDLAAKTPELVRALVIVRLVSSVRPIRHEDARMLIKGK
jgi:hypothetical protein